MSAVTEQSTTSGAPHERRRTAGAGRAPAAVVVPAVLVALGVLVTPAWLLVRALEGGADSWIAVFDGDVGELLQRTLVLAVVVVVACVVIAVPLALLTTRTDVPGRRVLGVAVGLPLVVPTFVGAYSLVAALAPGGLVPALVDRFGLDLEVWSPYGFGGAAVTLTLFSYPYVLLTTRAALLRLDPSQEEASRSLGVGPWRTIRRVVLPQLRPSIAAGSLLVALYVLSDFGAVSLLRYSTFTRVIYLRYTSSFDRSAAAVLGLVLVLLTVAILVLEARVGRARIADLSTGGGGVTREPTVLRLGRWRWPAAVACWSVVLAALAFPLAVVVGWMVRGLAAGEPVLPTAAAVGNTLLAAALGAAVAVAAAVPVALWAARRQTVGSRLVERATYTGYALPGIVVALSLVSLGVNLGPLYQSLALLVAAYVVLFLPQAVGAVRTSLLQVPPSVEEAARTLGDGPSRAMFRAVLPMAKGGAVSGGALVFLTVVKELPATLLLAPTGFETLATRVWATTSEAFFGRASGPALALILVGVVPLAVVQLLSGRTQRDPSGPRSGS